MGEGDVLPNGRCPPARAGGIPELASYETSSDRSRATGQWHRQAHRGAAARRGHELELATHQLRAFAHPRDAEATLQFVLGRALSARSVLWQPFAVVGYRRSNPAVALADADDRAGGFGVTTDVRECLLYNAIQRALELRVEPSIAVGQFDLGTNFQAVHRLRTPCQCFQGRHQTEVVERGRPELGDQGAQPVDLLAKPLEHRVDCRAQLGLVAKIACVGEPQPQSTKALNGFVVDLPGPACALALARLHAKAQALDL